MNDCPDSETLVAYTIGTLKRDQFIEVLKHVARCGSCRRASLTLYSVLHELAEQQKGEKADPA